MVPGKANILFLQVFFHYSYCWQMEGTQRSVASRKACHSQVMRLFHKMEELIMKSSQWYFIIRYTLLLVLQLSAVLDTIIHYLLLVSWIINNYQQAFQSKNHAYLMECQGVMNF